MHLEVVSAVAPDSKCLGLILPFDFANSYRYHSRAVRSKLQRGCQVNLNPSRSESWIRLAASLLPPPLLFPLVTVGVPVRFPLAATDDAASISPRLQPLPLSFLLQLDLPDGREWMGLTPLSNSSGCVDPSLCST